MIEVKELGPLAVAIGGFVVGVGLLLVRPASGEPERLNRIWPGMRFFRFTAVRIAIAIACFVVAFFELALMREWL